MYKVILFDLDGTLTDSGEGITKCVQYALEKIGRPEEDLEKLKVFVGPPLIEQLMSYAGVDEDTAREGVKYYRERFAPVGIYENKLYPGVKEMLEGLKRRGYRLGIASSKPEKFVKIVADYFEITEYFEVIAGSSMDETRTQKWQVIEEALLRLHMEKHKDRVLMVGDREHDVFGARKAGLECLGVTYGFGSEEELKTAGALQIVDHVEDITDFFEKPL